MNPMIIYNAAPIWIQNILTSLQGYKYRKERYGYEYNQYLIELRKRDYTNISKLSTLQDSLVADIVRFAFDHSPFYKKFYQGIEIDNIKSVKDLQYLPILEKETVRSNIRSIYTIPINEGIKSSTSGTTGTSMTFLYTKKNFQRRMAYLDFFKEQNGFVHMKMKRASFNSAKIVPANQKKPVFWRDNLAIKQRIYSGYHCQGENLKYYVDNLNKYKPHSMDGYPSSMYQLAKYIVSNNIKLKFKPVGIFPTAETLLPHYKTMIEKAFDCPVLDQYASSEGAPFITACKYGNLHYCMDTGVIEVDEDGEMLVTCFETHGTPLIRYRIGDKITFSSQLKRCPCGSCLPIVERIDGRGHDFLMSKSKGKFPALYMSLVSAEFQNSVKAMQFIQDTLDEIKVLLEVDENYNSEMNKIIIDKLHYSLGKDMIITVNIVKNIPKDKSGKFRFIINSVQNI
jgi:phenylacetate-CoA ligase